jgi:hypothetical protein
VLTKRPAVSAGAAKDLPVCRVSIGACGFGTRGNTRRGRCGVRLVKRRVLRKDASGSRALERRRVAHVQKRLVWQKYARAIAGNWTRLYWHIVIYVGIDGNAQRSSWASLFLDALLPVDGATIRAEFKRPLYNAQVPFITSLYLSFPPFHH